MLGLEGVEVRGETDTPRISIVVEKKIAEWEFDDLSGEPNISNGYAKPGYADLFIFLNYFDTFLVFWSQLQKSPVGLINVAILLQLLECFAHIVLIVSFCCSFDTTFLSFFAHAVLWVSFYAVLVHENINKY